MSLKVHAFTPLMATVGPPEIVSLCSICWSGRTCRTHLIEVGEGGKGPPPRPITKLSVMPTMSNDCPSCGQSLEGFLGIEHQGGLCGFCYEQRGAK